MTDKKTILVVCLPNNEYQRFEGRRRTHHVRCEERPLDAAEVELLRVRPEQLMEPEAA